jgi:hypothetical protein
MTMRLSAVLFVAWLVTACMPASVREPSPGQSASSAPPVQTTLCADLAAAYSERVALADAFRSLIAGDLASARQQAASIHARMDGLVAGLPTPSSLPSAAASLRQLVESTAQVLSGAADVLNPPTGDLDRQRALQDGQGMLALIDRTMSMTQPGSVDATSCPDVHWAAPEVSFPPPATAADFGLPDVAAGWSLRPLLASVGSDMQPGFRSLGIDPARVRYLRVDMSDGEHWERLDVYDGLNVTPKQLLAALPNEMLDGISSKTTGRTVNGFAVLRRGNVPADPLMITVAVRGSRAMVFWNAPDAVVDAVLRATTQ